MGGTTDLKQIFFNVSLRNEAEPAPVKESLRLIDGHKEKNQHDIYNNLYAPPIVWEVDGT
jgi:hypothetical protein